MGCNCGGGSTDEGPFLVMLPNGTKRLLRSEVGARLAVTMAGGGSWRIASEDTVRQLATEGVTLE